MPEPDKNKAESQTASRRMIDESALMQYFGFFNEIGIIEQLSRAMFEARLPDGVTVDHWAILNHLVRVSDGRTPLDIARAFQVPKTTITHRLSGLEKHGYVEIRPNPHDGRSKNVWLSEAGRKFRHDAILLLEEDIAAIANHTDIDTISSLSHALSEIRKFLDSYRDQPR